MGDHEGEGLPDIFDLPEIGEGDPFMSSVGGEDDFEMPIILDDDDELPEFGADPIPVAADSSDEEEEEVLPASNLTADGSNFLGMPTSVPEFASKPSAYVNSKSSDEFDLVYLTSMPLIYGLDLKTVARLNLDEERNLLRKCVENSELELMFYQDVAYFKSLQRATNRGAKVLHYSGHSLRKHILFESPTNIGMGNLVKETKVKNCVVPTNINSRQKQSQVQLLILASCHSETIGKSFVETGCPHVIAIKQEDEVDDECASIFMEAFYEALFWSRTIKQSYELAKAAVHACVPAEAKKFLLLPKNGPHDVVLFEHGTTQRGMFKDMSKHMAPTNLNPNQGFLARELDQCNVIQEVLKNKVTVVEGPVGVGKTSIMNEVAGYLRKHYLFRKGLFYIDCLEMAREYKTLDLGKIIFNTIVDWCKVAEIRDEADRELYGKVVDNAKAEGKIDAQKAHTVLDQMFKDLKLSASIAAGGQIEKEKGMLLVLDHLEFLMLPPNQWGIHLSEVAHHRKVLREESYTNYDEDDLEYNDENWRWLRKISKQFSRISILTTQYRRAKLGSTFSEKNFEVGSVQLKKIEAREFCPLFIQKIPAFARVKEDVLKELQKRDQDENQPSLGSPLYLTQYASSAFGEFTSLGDDPGQFLHQILDKLDTDRFDTNKHRMNMKKRVKVIKKSAHAMDLDMSPIRSIFQDWHFFDDKGKPKSTRPPNARQGSREQYRQSSDSLGKRMPSDVFDSPLPNVPEGHISVDNLRFQGDMDMRRLPSFNDSVCNINDLNMESYRQPECDPVRNRRKFEKWFKDDLPLVKQESTRPDMPLKLASIRNSETQFDGSRESLSSPMISPSNYDYHSADVEKFSQWFKYDCILPHGLKFWSKMFNVEVVSTNELLDALDRYIKDDVGLTQRGLFWKADQSNENVAKTDRIFNQLARREIKDWIAYWVHRRASESRERNNGFMNRPHIQQITDKHHKKKLVVETIHVEHFAFLWKARFHSILCTIRQLKPVWEQRGVIVGFLQKDKIEDTLKLGHRGDFMIRFSKTYSHTMIIAWNRGDKSRVPVQLDRLDVGTQHNLVRQILDKQEARRLYNPYSRTLQKKALVFTEEMAQVRSTFTCCVFGKIHGGNRPQYNLNSELFKILKHQEEERRRRREDRY